MDKHWAGAEAHLVRRVTHQLGGEEARVLGINLAHGQREHVTVSGAHKVRILRYALAIAQPDQLNGARGGRGGRAAEHKRLPLTQILTGEEGSEAEPPPLQLDLAAAHFNRAGHAGQLAAVLALVSRSHAPDLQRGFVACGDCFEAWLGQSLAVLEPLYWWNRQARECGPEEEGPVKVDGRLRGQVC